jgi:hypothetical protein
VPVKPCEDGPHSFYILMPGKAEIPIPGKIAPAQIYQNKVATRRLRERVPDFCLMADVYLDLEWKPQNENAFLRSLPEAATVLRWRLSFALIDQLIQAADLLSNKKQYSNKLKTR